MEKPHRRAFLEKLNQVGLASLLGAPFIQFLSSKSSAKSVKGSAAEALIGGRFAIPDTSYEAFGYQGYQGFKNNHLFKLDFETNRLSEFRTQTPAHSTQPHPIEPYLVACIAKKSDRISVFDWKKNIEIASFQSAKGAYFNGHAAFSDDGKLLLVSGLDYSKNANRPRGQIYILEFPTLRLDKIIELGGFKAHDIVAIGGNRFACGFLEETPGMASFGTVGLEADSFRPFSKKIEGVSGYFSMTHIDFDPGHSRIFGLGNVIEGSSLKAGSVFRFDIKTHEISVDFPVGQHDVSTELLSIEYDAETKYVWMTLPAQNTVAVWDLAKQKIASVLKVGRSPFSIAQVSSIDAMVVGTFDGLRAFDRRSFARLEARDSKWKALHLNKLSAAHTRII